MERMFNEAVIVAYGRSAIGRSGKGSLRDEHPVDFGAQVLNGVLAKVPALDTALIEDVIVGCVKPEKKQGDNIARVIAQRAGLPDSVPGQTVNRFCSSGLQAIATAANAIIAGQAEVLVAGGIESMSAVPMGRVKENLDPWLLENKPDIYLSMGLTAENVAAMYNVSREEMDKFAEETHAKYAAAFAKGEFKKEIIPVKLVNNPDMDVFEVDECPRPGTTAEKLATLAPCFKEDGVVTAATSSPTSDGAAFVVLMSEKKAKELGIKPIARFVSFAVAGVPPEIMGIGPMKAAPKALALAGLTADDMDIIEINEAFAAQSIPCIATLEFDKSKVNPRGGAIALGHPLGATGAILTCKALSYLEDNGGKYALITMCIGGGQGAAGVFEMV